MDAKTEKKSATYFVSRPRTSGFLVFLLLFLMVGYIVYQRYQIVVENNRREMSNVLRVVYENVEQSIKNSSTAALTLALTINDDGVPENFDAVGKQLILANPDIDAVQLLPEGIIRYVYPLEQNSLALGLNILQSPENRPEAMASMRSKKMYFAGPLKLKQGGTGVIGRLPVYINNEFWGFSGVLIKMENLIKVSGIHSIDESKYYFQFSHVNTVTRHNEFFLPDKTNFSSNYYDSITFPDTDWTLYIIGKNEDDIYFQMLPLAVSGTLLALLFGFIITILLRKPAELQLLVMRQTRKLLNSEIKYKAIFDQAAVGIAHIDTNTKNFIDVNEQFSKLLGYTCDEIKGMNVTQVMHEDDIPQTFANIEKLKNGETFQFSVEKRYITKSGSTVWMSVSASPLWKPGEKPTALIAVAEDVTIKKEAKEEIAKSEARFKSLFEDSPVALWEEDFSEVKRYLAQYHADLNEHNAEGFFEAHPEALKKCISLVKIVDVNNQCLELHKPNTKKQLLDANLVALLDDDSTKSLIKQLVAVIAGANLVTMNTRIKNPGGDFRDIYLRWSVMRGYEDTLERVIISTEDITIQKESEQIIINSQRRIEDLVNSIDGIVWECGTEEYELIFISKKVEEILGYTPQEWALDNNFWSKHIHPEDRETALEIFLSVARDLRSHEFEYRMVKSDGSIVWIRDSITINLENGKPVSLRGIMIDITRNKEAENDLNSTLGLVNEQKKRLMNFSYIVSHNLRSHTANIHSIITLVEESESDDERKEMLEMLKTVSASLNETMMNLNDLVNIQTNITLVIESLNINQYIENTAKVLSEQIDSIGVTIVNNVPHDAVVKYNPAYLESILLNLVSNAIRYRHSDRKPVIIIDWIDNEGKKALRVSDNGIGIDVKKHGDKLFGMYKTFNGNADARGVGLFMTRSQIEAMGGKISVESELGKGTAFEAVFM